MKWGPEGSLSVWLDKKLLLLPGETCYDTIGLLNNRNEVDIIVRILLE